MNGRTFLEQVLEHPTDAELAGLIDTLVNERVPEDTWLDYKDGLSTGRVNTTELRRDVTAFGNSDGGCLVIGVSEEDKRPTGFSTCNGDIARAMQQIDGVLISLSGLLFPPPRAARLVTMPTGDLAIVVALPRSGRLAAVNEGGMGVHYIRVADGKHRTPEWLMSDLAFGRRQQAVLSIRPDQSNVVELEVELQKATVRLELENHGPHYAQRWYGGALFGALDTESGEPIDSHHLAYRKAVWEISPGLKAVHRRFDVHPGSQTATLRPFDVQSLAYWGAPAHDKQFPYNLAGCCLPGN